MSDHNPANPSGTTDEPAAPIVVCRTRRLSAAWILPLIAIVAAGFLGWRAWKERGVPVWITFSDAAGLRPGNDVVYRGISVGTIRDVRLAPEARRVVVEAMLRPQAAPLAAEGTRFWIARPEVSLAGVTGLETLIGPTYLNILPGEGDSKPQFVFDGLSERPNLDAADPGLRIILRIDQRGTVSVGSPILFRDVAVGRVEGVRLAADARSVEVEAVIAEPYAHLVREKTRFFKATGIGIDFGWFGGLSVRAESLEALVGGAIGFATPPRPGEIAADGAEFEVAPAPDPDWLEWDPPLAPG